MPNPDRRLLRISDTNITYLQDTLNNQQKSIREEARTDAAASTNATELVPNMSSPATMSTLSPEAPISDLPEEPSILLPTTLQYDLTSE